MASEQYGAVFDVSQDDDEEPSSSGNDDVLNNNDEEEDEELLEDEEEDFNSPPSLLPQPIAAVVSSVAIPVVPLALPSSDIVTVASVPIEEPTPDSKRQRIDSSSVVTPEKKPTPQQPFVDESRRLFQRLWTDEDEIELLKGFLDYTASKSSLNSAYHHDTAVFYDLIKSKLQLDFNKNQLVEKLRRLKKKYRNVMSKINSGKDFSFKSPHDQATFEISRKIWCNSVGKVEENVLDYDENNSNINSNSNVISNPNINLIDESGEKKNLFTPNSKTAAPKKRSRSKGGKLEEKSVLNDGFVISNNNANHTSDHDHSNVEGLGAGGGGVGVGERGNLPGVIEEAVKSCLTPLFKELLGSLTGGGRGGRGISGLAMNPMPLSFGGALNFGGANGVNGELMDERWRKQQILELEVYSKRLELVQDQVKTALEELRSTGG